MQPPFPVMECTSTVTNAAAAVTSASVPAPLPTATADGAVASVVGAADDSVDSTAHKY